MSLVSLLVCLAVCVCGGGEGMIDFKGSLKQFHTTLPFLKGSLNTLRNHSLTLVSNFSQKTHINGSLNDQKVHSHRVTLTIRGHLKFTIN